MVFDVLKSCRHHEGTQTNIVRQERDLLLKTQKHSTKNGINLNVLMGN